MPHLSCGAKFSRVVLVILNIIILLCGLTALGLGIYLLVNGNFNAILVAHDIIEALGSTTMFWIGMIMTIVGGFTTCFAVFGCLGAAYKHRIFLYLYALLLILVIFIEFAAVIVILKCRNDLWISYDDGFEKVFFNAYHLNQTETIKMIEDLEQQFKCCGVNSYRDYNLVGLFPPNSCYPNQIPRGSTFSQGCALAIATWIWDGLPIIAGIIGFILLIEMFGIISSLILGVAISYAQQSDIDYDT